MRRVCIALLFASLASAAEDPRDIIRRSVMADERAERLRLDYTWRVLRQGVEDGKPTSRLQEVLFLAGRKHERLIEKDGKPLPAAEEQKERQKLDRAVAEAAGLTLAQRQKRIDEALGGIERQRQSSRSIPDAFDFTLEKEAAIDGRPVWQIRARPKRGYKGHGSAFFGKLEGTVWIDKRDYARVRVEVTALDTISVGLFLLRVTKSSEIRFESAKVNDELWAVTRVRIRFSARFALVKKVAGDEEFTYSDYKRFRTDSRLVGTEEVH